MGLTKQELILCEQTRRGLFPPRTPCVTHRLNTLMLRSPPARAPCATEKLRPRLMCSDSVIPSFKIHKREAVLPTWALLWDSNPFSPPAAVLPLGGCCLQAGLERQVGRRQVQHQRGGGRRQQQQLGPLRALMARRGPEPARRCGRRLGLKMCCCPCVALHGSLRLKRR